MKKIKIITLVLVCFITTNIMSQTNETAEKKENKVNFSLGLGFGFTPQYEGSSDVLALPALTFAANWTSGQYIRFVGSGIESNVLSSRTWEFGPKLGFILPRNEDIVDNGLVTALEELDLSLTLGLFTRYRFGKGFDVKVEYTHDVSGVSEGGVAALDLGYTFKGKRFITRLSANTSYATENYMETYFGVNPQNLGSSLLPLYDLGGGIKDVGTSISTTYIINKNWMLSGQLGYNLLLGDVADSPIVNEGSENQLSGGLVAIYRF